MPIFINRHGIRGVTAETVAAVHQEDLKVQARHTCRILHAGSSFTGSTSNGDWLLLQRGVGA